MKFITGWLIYDNVKYEYAYTIFYEGWSHKRIHVTLWPYSKSVEQTTKLSFLSDALSDEFPVLVEEEIYTYLTKSI